MTDIAAYERNKYERMWAYDSYRINSPGEHVVDKFLEGVRWEREDSALDAGCGTGRAAHKLSLHGLDVTMLDFCPSAVDPSIGKLGFPFIDANLWDEAWIHSRLFDWIFCADVMEHIPPDYVETVLTNLAAVCAKGGFFQIAMFEDGCGREIGEPLHLTICGVPWWIEQLSKHFNVKRQESDQLRLLALVAKL